MHSFIDFIINGSENEMCILVFFATKCFVFIIQFLFEIDILCPFILVIRPTSIKYVNIANASLHTFTFIHGENMLDVD